MAQAISKNSPVIVETPFHGSTFSFETGWIAKQAGGSVLARAGDTVVLAAVCTGPARAEQSFFPLTVEYVEKAYAAGKIPGGFFKREGKPSEHEILTARLVDRPVRPLFTDGFFDEVQVICTVISADGVNSPDVLAICAAGAALHISPLPFLGPMAAVRVGKVDGQLVINPAYQTLPKAALNLIVAGTREALVMVEGEADVLPEAEVLDALFFGHQEIQKILDMQEALRSKVGKEKLVVVPKEKNTALIEKVTQLAAAGIETAVTTFVKQERGEAFKKVETDVKEAFAAEITAKPELQKEIAEIIHELAAHKIRERILAGKPRLDGRDLTTVRPITVETGIVPRAHGSALFTRGETQALVTTTLGTSIDAQLIDALTERSERKFMLHYNFPPYSTGEVKMMRGTGRREVGHGKLAERSLGRVMPAETEFPYVVRIVSDIMESNGSSSMATVCGGSLSLMDAGVQTKAPVAGVAMGLVTDGARVAVLTDILGDEDHFGDMDFKVAGTKEGVTGLQMDIKCKGLSRSTMEKALEQARQARLHILGEMEKVLDKPRAELSKFAPQIETIKINPDKIRDVIGPGGKTIRSITETTGVKIDISDDGTVMIASPDGEASKRAIEIIRGLTEEAEIGRIYKGVVKRITDFGAFVEILPGVEGLVHISQLAHERVKTVSDVVREGDETDVRVLDIDQQGRIRLSRKEALGDDRGGARR
jgi:polyribonucleotide nucleotidyltransferase